MLLSDIEERYTDAKLNIFSKKNGTDIISVPLILGVTEFIRNEMEAESCWTYGQCV